MKKLALTTAAAIALSSSIIISAPVMSQQAEDKPVDVASNKAEEKPYPSPNAIVDAAPASEWKAISASDLLIMDIADDRDGNKRRVIIQLMPAPFSQGWVENIRTLSRAKFWDGLSINRVQDNYVTQWGDPEEEDAKRRKLPANLKTMSKGDYVSANLVAQKPNWTAKRMAVPAQNPIADNYAGGGRFWGGWPFAFSTANEKQPIAITDGAEMVDGKLKINGKARKPKPSENLNYWPIHCYGMVGVGRGYSPDTGSGAELYTVIGHAPRHLDRNIALVGRIIEGMEHLSSLPRGKGTLGFYTDPKKRVPITSIRLASDLPNADEFAFEYLNTDGATFGKYAQARANRRDPFFIEPAGGADICNIPVPVRQKKTKGAALKAE